MQEALQNWNNCFIPNGTVIVSIKDEDNRTFSVSAMKSKDQ
jgi:hypothetical protein